jgi:N-acetylglucosamine repressor
MIRKQLIPQPQPEGSTSHAPAADDQGEIATDFSSRRGSRALLRDLNVSLLIELVRRAGSISRAELARRSSLSAPTVSTIVENLVTRGIFNEVAIAPSSGGRPPVLVSMDPKAGYIIGIKLRADGLTTVICDLEAQVVASREIEVALVGDPAVTIRAVEQETRRILHDAVIPDSKVLGVGIGAPVSVDTSTGICTFSNLLSWRNVDLAGPLGERLGFPVWVENDVNTLAVAEKWAGDATNARDFVTLSIGSGVGLGIVIDRSLYRGADGAAGEFGHVIVKPGGARCKCGALGCLEALVGEDALRRSVGEQIGRNVSRNELIELAESGDAVALEVLSEAGQMLGLAVANMMTLLNPELLIICGEGTQLGASFLDPVVAAVRELTFANLGKKVEVKVQRWGDEAWAVGAATLVLRELFSIPNIDAKSNAIWHRINA